MKNIFKGFLAATTLGVVLTIASCTKTCDTGFEGSDCKTEMRTKLLKTGAAVTETLTGDTSVYHYNVDIVTDSDPAKFRIKNLGNYNCSTGDYYVTVNVASTNSYTFSGVVSCATTFNGNASYDGTSKKLTVTYTATYGTPTKTDNATAIIQL